MFLHVDSLPANIVALVRSYALFRRVNICMVLDVIRHKELVTYVVASLLLTVISMLLRLIIGLFSGITAVLIEGFHAMLDVIITVMVLVSVLIVRSQMARRLPYGLYKLEDLATLIIATLLIIVAIEVGVKGLGNIPRTVSLIPALIQLLSLSPLGLSAYLKVKASEIINSPSLRADGLHTVGDVLEGGGVALGLLIFSYTSSYMAYQASTLVAIAGIMVAAYEAGHDSVLSILDFPKDKNMLRKMSSLVESVASELKLVSLKARWAGPVIFVEAVLRAPPLRTVEDISIVCRRITNSLKREVPSIADVTIMVEPSTRNNFTVCIPLDEPLPSATISQHFGKAKYFLIARIREGKVHNIEILENRYKEKKLRNVPTVLLVGARVVESLYRKGVTDVIVYNIGEVAYSLLLRHKIIIWKADELMQARDLLKEFLSFKLKRLQEPTHEEPWMKAHST